MALVFECVRTEGIAELSYLLGDDSEGIAAVFDPTPDVDKYIALGREKKVSITHVFETHIHADLVSGVRELCDRVEAAKVFLSHEGDARYGFDHEQLKHGDQFIFGKTIVTVRHTPGHTPEHVSFVVADKDHPDTPWGVLTGDSLFVNSAGRPDLLGSGETETLTRQLFETLRGFYLALPDSVIIYPAHGHGSPCGADIGDRLESTIGYERKFNPFLQFTDFERFKAHAQSTAPPVPKYYPLMKKLNARGPKVLGHLPRAPGLPPKTFHEAVQKGGGVLVDTRMMLAFGGGYVKGALNLGGAPMLSIWAGWLLDPDEPILLVLNEDTELEEIVKLFIRTGYTKFAGYLVGGMRAWDNAGLPLEEVGQMTVHEVRGAGSRLQIVDVRAPAEWKKGHVPGARHIFVPDLRETAHELDKDRPTAVYCDSGYRASIGTSILKQEGFARVCNVPGSWQAWKKAKFPIEGAEEET
ncbi:MAG: MBL fold metallo-hydrolase [Verrucomicrobiales bacterium]